MRIANDGHPLASKFSSIRGSVCLSFAAALALRARMVQVCSSTAPALSWACNAGGIASAAMANLAFDSQMRRLSNCSGWLRLNASASVDGAGTDGGKEFINGSVWWKDLRGSEAGSERRGPSVDETRQK